MQAIRAFTRRTIRATGFAVRDRRIPRPLRWLAGLALLPVPGPFDEAVLLLVAMPLFAFYRRPLRDAWLRAAPVGGGAGPTTVEIQGGHR
jgi:hypothetical protein